MLYLFLLHSWIFEFVRIDHPSPMHGHCSDFSPIRVFYVMTTTTRCGQCFGCSSSSKKCNGLKFTWYHMKSVWPGSNFSLFGAATNVVTWSPLLHSPQQRGFDNVNVVHFLEFMPPSLSGLRFTKKRVRLLPRGHECLQLSSSRGGQLTPSGEESGKSISYFRRRYTSKTIVEDSTIRHIVCSLSIY